MMLITLRFIFSDGFLYMATLFLCAMAILFSVLAYYFRKPGIRGMFGAFLISAVFMVALSGFQLHETGGIASVCEFWRARM